MKPTLRPTATATQNACKLCTPLGACLVFRGIERAIPLLHGSQGCATYMRRFLISHFREPVDIASSSFSETTTIFGGRDDLHRGLANVIRQYEPAMIGVLTTCLAETIGEDLRLSMAGFTPPAGVAAPAAIVPVNTPSYCGTHEEGFHAAVRAVVEKLVPAPTRDVAAPAAGEAAGTGTEDDPAAMGDAICSSVNIFPGMVSPADLRHLRELVESFGLGAMLLPDYADSLDGEAEAEYLPITRGGTPIAAIRAAGGARASFTFGQTLPERLRGSHWLAQQHGVAEHVLGLPIGIRATDAFVETLAELSGRPLAAPFTAERGRLLDAYVDAHKYLFGRRAVVYGEAELVAALAQFLAEVGAVPVVCATGTTGGALGAVLSERLPRLRERIKVIEGVDFAEIGEAARAANPDFMLGNSRGYSTARELCVPLVRIGMPVHDRIGGQRLLSLGYRGTQQLFDRIVNALLENAQDSSPVGYAYL